MTLFVPSVASQPRRAIEMTPNAPPSDFLVSA
ncbi:hypothetical protein SAMN05444161_4654 [Rhizobiales bacterium GAS191]|nr:hypothetical protein SAMN05444161_4654 [Rhizobiales bacterium GAS191]